MIVNSANLDALRVGFSTAFSGGLGQAEGQYQRIATVVPSSAQSNKYGWLGKMPNFREWVGPRHFNGLAEHGYSIENKAEELSIAVDRDDIEDDNIGVYSPLFTEMGLATGARPDQLCFEALANGFTGECYDGQSFFDTDHPVLDADGNATTVANTDGGSGTPWFLLCTGRALKPIIYQERRKAQFVAKDAVTDDNVFNFKEFQYGVDGRWAVGYGFWQMAWGSKQTLNAANYKIARAALMGMTGDGGRPLGLRPDLLVVPPSLEGNAMEILNAERDAAGATNVWKGTAEMLVGDWLPAAA